MFSKVIMQVWLSSLFKNKRPIHLGLSHQILTNTCSVSNKIKHHKPPARNKRTTVFDHKRSTWTLSHQVKGNSLKMAQKSGLPWTKSKLPLLCHKLTR